MESQPPYLRALAGVIAITWPTTTATASGSSPTCGIAAAQAESGPGIHRGASREGIGVQQVASAIA